MLTVGRPTGRHLRDPHQKTCEGHNKRFTEGEARMANKCIKSYLHSQMNVLAFVIHHIGKNMSGG